MRFQLFCASVTLHTKQGWISNTFCLVCSGLPKETNRVAHRSGHNFLVDSADAT